MDNPDSVDFPETLEEIDEDVRFDAFALPRMLFLPRPEDRRVAIAFFRPSVTEGHRLQQRLFR